MSNVSERIRNIIHTERYAGKEFCNRFQHKDTLPPFLPLSIIREQEGRHFFEQNIKKMQKDKKIKKCFRLQISYEGIGQDEGTKGLLNPILQQIDLEWTDKNLKPKIIDTIRNINVWLGNIGYVLRYFLLPFIVLPLSGLLISNAEKRTALKDMLIPYLIIAVVTIVIIALITALFSRKKTGTLFRLRRTIDYVFGGEKFYPDVLNIFISGLYATYHRSMRHRKYLVLEMEGMERLAVWQAKEIEEFLKEVQKARKNFVVIIYWDRRKAIHKRFEDIPFSNPLEIENIHNEGEWQKIVEAIFGCARWRKLQILCKKNVDKNDEHTCDGYLKWVRLRTFGNPILIEEGLEKLLDKMKKIKHNKIANIYHSDWDKALGLRQKFLEFKFQREWARLKHSHWIDKVERLGIIEQKFRQKENSFQLQDFTNTDWQLYRQLFDFSSDTEVIAFLEDLKKELVLDDIEDIRFSSANLAYLFAKDTRMGNATKREQAQVIAECFQKIGSGLFKEIATELYYEEGDYTNAIICRLQEIQTKRDENGQQDELLRLIQEAEQWCERAQYSRDILSEKIHNMRNSLEDFGIFKGLLLYIFNHKQFWNTNPEQYFKELQDQFRLAENKFSVEFVNFQQRLVEAYFERIAENIHDAENKIREAQVLFEEIPKEEKAENEIALLLTRGFIELKSQVEYKIPMETFRLILAKLENTVVRNDLSALVHSYYGYALAKGCEGEGTVLSGRVEEADIEMQKGLRLIESKGLPIENSIRCDMTKFYRKFLRQDRIAEQLDWFQREQCWNSLPDTLRGDIKITEATAQEQQGNLTFAEKLYGEAIAILERKKMAAASCRARFQYLIMLDILDKIDSAIENGTDSLQYALNEQAPAPWPNVFRMLLAWFYYRCSKAPDREDIWHVTGEKQRELWAQINQNFHNFAGHNQNIQEDSRPAWHADLPTQKISDTLQAISFDYFRELKLESLMRGPKTSRPFYPLLACIHRPNFTVDPSINQYLQQADRKNDIYYHTLFLLYNAHFYAIYAKNDSEYQEQGTILLKRTRDVVTRDFYHLRSMYNTVNQLLDNPSENLSTSKSQEPNSDNSKLSLVAPTPKKAWQDVLQLLHDRRKKNPPFDAELFPFHMLSYFDKTYEIDPGTSKREKHSILSFMRNTSIKLQTQSALQVAAEVRARAIRIALDHCDMETARRLVTQVAKEEPTLSQHPLMQTMENIYYFHHELRTISQDYQELLSLPLSPIFLDYLFSHLMQSAILTNNVENISMPKTISLPHTLFVLPVQKKHWWAKFMAHLNKSKLTVFGEALFHLSKVKSAFDGHQFPLALQQCRQALGIIEKFQYISYHIRALLLETKILIHYHDMNQSQEQNHREIGNNLGQIEQFLAHKRLPLLWAEYYRLNALHHFCQDKMSSALDDIAQASQLCEQNKQITLTILEDHAWIEYFTANTVSITIEKAKKCAPNFSFNKRWKIIEALNESKPPTNKIVEDQDPIWTAMAIAALTPKYKINPAKYLNKIFSTSHLSLNTCIAAVIIKKALSKGPNNLTPFSKIFRRHKEKINHYLRQKNLTHIEKLMEN